MKLGETVAFCLPFAGRRTQLFHLIFTEPGAHLLEHPCTVTLSIFLFFQLNLWEIQIRCEAAAVA